MLQKEDQSGKSVRESGTSGKHLSTVDITRRTIHDRDRRKGIENHTYTNRRISGGTGRQFSEGSGRKLVDRKNIRRRRILQRRIYLATAVFGVVFCVIVGMGIHALGKSKKAEAASGQPADAKGEDIEIEAQVTETPKQQVARVKQEAAEKGYPEDIIELLDKNPETLPFVEDFELRKDAEIAKTVGEGLEKGEIPHLLQWDERWGYAPYGTGYVATCGCGPTCLSMVISGMTGDASVTPAVVAKYSDKEGYIDKDNNTYWALMSAAPEHWGLSVKEGKTSEDYVASELKDGNVIICSVGPGDFTKIGHFIVLTAYKNGKVKVLDPFSVANSEKLWKYAKIKDQIKSMWVYSN